MSSSSPIGCLQRLMAALLVLVIAATAASAANVGTPVKNGAAHAIAAIGRQLAPAKPEPSRRMGKKKRAGGAKTRRTKGRNDYSQFLCPSKVDACPIAAPGETLAAVKRAELKVLADWFKAGFECIDTQTELVSCGGCMSLGQGQDCTAILHASEIGCDKGVCVVSECQPGFTLSKDGRHCLKRATPPPAEGPAPAAR